MPAGNRKLTRIQVAGLRRTARKREQYVVDCEFPTHIAGRVRRHHPEIDETSWSLVELGLREWFICCAWRGRAVLGMPSRAVDEAWHEFILDSLAYTRFCRGAYGDYLHHTPDEAMATSMGDALGETVRAWDRSEAGRERESVLWDLDERLGVPEPLGLNGIQLASARSRTTVPGVTACFVGMPVSDSGGASGGEGGDGGGGGGS